MLTLHVLWLPMEMECLGTQHLQCLRPQSHFCRHPGWSLWPGAPPRAPETPPAPSRPFAGGTPLCTGAQWEPPSGWEHGRGTHCLYLEKTNNSWNWFCQCQTSELKSSALVFLLGTLLQNSHEHKPLIQLPKENSPSFTRREGLGDLGNSLPGPQSIHLKNLANTGSVLSPWSRKLMPRVSYSSTTTTREHEEVNATGKFREINWRGFVQSVRLF